MAITLIETRDHSHTLYVPELDETYHSRNGAMEEALHVYIGKGYTDWLTDHGSRFTEGSQHRAIHILEIGFGTGLNAWLTAMECEKSPVHCHYHSIETFPLQQELVEQLNYTDNTPEHKQLFRQLHEVAWNTAVAVTPFFTLQKEQIALQSYRAPTTFDVIYFDAFAPEKQPELWTEEIFHKLFEWLNPGGIIVTYSSKGEIRRMWQRLGFEVERLPGPPFKRHMLRGRKGSRI